MKVRIALLSLALVAAAACGGDDDDEAAVGEGGQRTEESGEAEQGPVLTKEEFVAAANALCKANDQRIIAIAEEFTKTERSGFEPTAKEIQKFVAATLPEFRRLLRELGQLRAPKADQRAFEDLIEQGDDAVRTVDGIKDDSEVLLSRAFGDAFATFNRGAFTLGLTDCGESEHETFSGGGH